MQRKNLQKAIILSLILSSNIYSMALAAESFQIVDNDTLVINEAVGQVNGDELGSINKLHTHIVLNAVCRDDGC